MRVQASRYLDRLNAVVVDVQARGEYLGGFRVRVGKDGPSLHHGEDDSNEERGGRSLPPEGGDYGDVVIFVHPRPVPLH